MNAKSGYELLFQKGMIAGMEVKNRIVQPATCTLFASRNGEPTPRTLRYYAERARGGFGLIIVEYSYIDQKASQSMPTQIGIYDDKCIPGLATLAETIKDNGARAGIQIEHCGNQKFLGTYPMVAPSPIPYEDAYNIGSSVMPTELTMEEIWEIEDSFAEAAGRAKRAGFDLVELHAAHGYLLTEFLSPYYNRRTDWYGGSLENRMRLVLETVYKIRKKVGRNYPLSTRISADEYIEGGITIQESQELAKELEKAGVDVIHQSAGNYMSLGKQIAPLYEPLGLNLHLAEAIKKVVSIPVIANGSINTPELMDEALRKGKADFISIARQALADPYFPKKVQEGRHEDVVPCIRCNEGCINRGTLAAMPVKCTVNPALGREEEYKIVPASKPKKVAIIGGGPAGMEAAIVARLRGHSVTLYEKRDKLGGYLLEGAIKEDINRLLQYYLTQLQKLNVKCVTNTEATPEMVRKAGFDSVVVAVGASPIIPPIRGIDKKFVVSIVDVVGKRADVGERVVIAGGGAVGCETAALLAELGKKVTIVETSDDVPSKIDVCAYKLMKKMLSEGKVETKTGVKLDEITDEGIMVIDKDLQRHNIGKVDTLILALGLAPRTGIATSFESTATEVCMIGDCVQARELYDAIREGYLAALRI